MKKKLSFLLSGMTALSMCSGILINVGAQTELPTTVSADDKNTHVIQTTDTKEKIQEYLDSAKDNADGVYTKILFESGKNYTYAGNLTIYSNTIIEATGATITKTYESDYLKSSMMHNAAVTDTSTTGSYDCTKNVYIHGGTWSGGDLSQLTNGGTNIYFAHSQNIHLLNATFENNYGAHLVEFNSTKDSSIENCTFNGQRVQEGSNVSKLAIEIDLAYGQTTSDHSAIASGYAVDGTTCDNISVTGCTFNTSDNGYSYYAQAIGCGTIQSGSGIYSTNINISNNTINNCSYIGIDPGGWKNSTISGNTLTKCDFGIYNIKSASNTISNNTLSSCGYGLYATSSSDTTISGNKITSNDNQGILSINSTNTAIKDNTIVTSQYGLYSYNSTGTSMTGNNITTTSSSGIYNKSSTSSNIANNTVSSSSTNGIYDNESSSTSVTGNHISSCGHGIYATNSNGTYSSNTINGVTGYGIYVSGSSSSYIRSNNITSAKYGVWCQGRSTINALSANTVTSCSYDSLHVTGGSYAASISGNILTHGRDGIYFGGGATCKTANRNQINHFANSDIYVTGGSNITSLSTSNSLNYAQRGVYVDGKSYVANCNNISINHVTYGAYVTGKSQIRNLNKNSIKYKKKAYYTAKGSKIKYKKSNKTKKVKK